MTVLDLSKLREFWCSVAVFVSGTKIPNSGITQDRESVKRRVWGQAVSMSQIRNLDSITEFPDHPTLNFIDFILEVLRRMTTFVS